MKSFTITFICLLLGVSHANAQTAEAEQPIIQALPIEVTFNKTTSILFPTVIKSVDRGSRDILAQKASGVGNVLQLKAGRENFPETNLTVITADGVLHHFTVNYSKQPITQTVRIGSADSDSSLIFQNKLTEAELDNLSRSITESKRAIYSISESSNKVGLALLGIYIKDDVLFFRLRITNKSNIGYDVDLLKFYIRDKARIKRTASQEIELKPIYSSGESKTIPGKSSSEIVFTLNKFTIPESKYLTIEVFEQNGGRNLDLKIKNKTIVNARLIE